MVELLLTDNSNLFAINKDDKMTLVLHQDKESLKINTFIELNGRRNTVIAARLKIEMQRKVARRQSIRTS